MKTGSCHCGAVTIEVPSIPEKLTSCNCSICRRLGNLMAYYHPSNVTIRAEEGATVPYIWGDKMLAFHHCGTCGCTTHWLGLDPKSQERMGINVRMFDPAEIEGLRIRRFDGAETWKFLD